MAIPQRRAPLALPEPFPIRTGKVLAIDTAGVAIVDIDGGSTSAAISTHLPLLVPGQRVSVLMPAQEEPIIVAAYPVRQPLENADAHVTPMTGAAIGFDPQTGTLSIQAQRLDLSALGSIEIRCGDSVLRLTAQGNAFLQAQAITQSATGPFRIEGASIDLN